MSERTTPRRPVSPAEILDALDHAIADHLAWLGDWHHSVLCRPAAAAQKPVDPHHLCRFGSWYVKNQHRSLVDQPALRTLARLHWKMHDLAQELAESAEGGSALPADPYAAFLATVNDFVGQGRRLEKAFSQAASELDPLTGLHNRQAMFSELERQRTRFLRSGHPCAVAIADLDHFKQVNDTFGHAAGDGVLRATAECFLGHVRPYDSVYRYGGEEFLFCLPDADLDLAWKILERLRLRLESNPVILETGEELSVTASFGVTGMSPRATVEGTIERADQALYSAKNRGRNRVCGWDAPDDVEEPADGGG